MQKTLKFLAATVAAMFLVVGLSACASETVDLKNVAAVIDVRTPDEYSMGHLKGAINIDVEAGDFQTQIDKLDKTANYVLYCHSGRRAGIALDTMKAAGFSGTLTNAGGITDATNSLALPIVVN